MKAFNFINFKCWPVKMKTPISVATMRTGVEYGRGGIPGEESSDLLSTKHVRFERCDDCTLMHALGENGIVYQTKDAKIVVLKQDEQIRLWVGMRIMFYYRDDAMMYEIQSFRFIRPQRKLNKFTARAPRKRKHDRLCPKCFYTWKKGHNCRDE